MASPDNASPIYERPEEILQQLIRFDTTNPPGNEADCIAYISDLLAQAGIESTILSAQPERANVVARILGRGAAPPLLLYGHVDVVTTANQQWDQPPFEGRLVDGIVWGRGAIDMKGGVAMMLAAFLRAHTEDLDLPGDVVFAAVCDEEAGQGYGARYLVENHPELFEGIQYAIGESGAFSWYVGGRRFYPIMLAEKQRCVVKATVRGPGGHGSKPIRGGAMAKLAQLLHQLDTQHLPVHITPVPRLMLESMACTLGGTLGRSLQQLLDPELTNDVLESMGDLRPLLHSMLHNTVSPTILHGSEKINVIPSEVSVELDCRVLPGYTPEDYLAELRQIVGEGVELEVSHCEPARPAAGMGLYNTLSDILVEADPDGLPVPLLVVGGTDARQFARIGIDTYGFLPMPVPEDQDHSSLIHAANERVPVSAIRFGADAITELLQRFGDWRSVQPRDPGL